MFHLFFVSLRRFLTCYINETLLFFLSIFPFRIPLFVVQRVGGGYAGACRLAASVVCAILRRIVTARQSEASARERQQHRRAF